MTGGTPIIDLLPAARRVRYARRAAVSGWIIAVILVAMLSLAPAGAMALASSAGVAGVAERTARSERTLNQLVAEKPRLETELADLRRTDAVLRAVEDRVDWRPMLAALAEAAGSARFERTEFRLDRDAARVEVKVVALVESLTDARAFVLRIEELGVFDTVTLQSNARVGLPNTEVVRVEIIAQVSPGSRS